MLPKANDLAYCFEDFDKLFLPHVVWNISDEDDLAHCDRGWVCNRLGFGLGLISVPQAIIRQLTRVLGGAG